MLEIILIMSEGGKFRRAAAIELRKIIPTFALKASRLTLTTHLMEA
jgi:hypothetical protein